jgi:hypothetical protein
MDSGNAIKISPLFRFNFLDFSKIAVYTAIWQHCLVPAPLWAPPPASLLPRLDTKVDFYFSEIHNQYESKNYF